MSIALALERWKIEKDRLTLAREEGILVDEQDEWLLSCFNWHIHSKGYVVVQCNGPVYLHHMIMGCPIWDRVIVDHGNRTPSDNRRTNLKWVTHAENLRNNSHPLGQTGMRGTTINRNGKYLSRVYWNGETYHLGTFDTLDEAVAEREEWIASKEADNG